jgi:hypothetical protein
VSGASPTYAWGAGLWNTGEPNNSGGRENCAQYSASGKLNDLPCSLTATGAGDLLWGCCEAPASPVNTCPAGFTGLDSAGYCYKGLTVAGGYNWDTASSACRALNGGNAWSASPINTDTAVSITTNMCAGTLVGTSFWSGVRDNTGPIAGHNDPRATYWHFMSAGFISPFLHSDVTYWNSGE